MYTLKITIPKFSIIQDLRYGNLTPGKGIRSKTKKIKVLLLHDS